MDPKQISSLAKLLRDSGDKVLNANFKLTLSGSLLHALNDSFTLIADQNEVCPPHTFQVVKTNNSKSGVFRDLQFIHDFVQKTNVLLITQFTNDDLPFDGRIDIGKFRNLRRLELQRICINQVIGIQQMRAHLQEIICTRCLDNVEDIISHCGGDRSSGFMWNELKLADFSYNTLTTIDGSLEFAQWLQHLNLSHNRIISVDAIKWLPNLKYLNLSYNRLTHIPMFNMDASKRLKTLILSNNYIEDVGEISRLDSLTDLDLSGNCLLDHSYLLPLSTLISLTYLNLESNPLACHPKHRQATARYLHKNTSTVKFILDTEQLTKSEKNLTGTYQSYHSILTSRISMSSLDRKSSGQSTPTTATSKWVRDQTAASSLSSTNSLIINTSKGLDTTTPDEMTSSTSTQKRVRARNAIISDISDDTQLSHNKTADGGSGVCFEGNKEYLETKKRIEDSRHRFGDRWLLYTGNTISDNKINDLAAEKVRRFFEKIGTDFPVDQIAPLLASSDKSHENNDNEINMPVSVSPNMNITDNSIDFKEGSDNQKLEQLPSITAKEKQVDLNDIYATQTSSVIDNVSDSEENEITYIVHLEPSNDEIFLVVSDFSIKEKDIINGRTKNKWNLKSLESCDQIRTNVLRLNFDTVKRDKKERIYKIESGVCQGLKQFLRNILSKRPLSEMNLTIYRCANCTTQFSGDNIYKKQNIDLCCPKCKSTYIVEIKEPPRAQSMEKTILHQQQQQQLPPTYLLEKRKTLDKCESFSSTGSAISLNESSSCSKISKSEEEQSSFDSNQSVAGSSSVACDQDFDNSQNNTGSSCGGGGSGANGESDIEILSNPSQSSIEVLDSFYSNRKHSDERRISQIPSLDTIADNSYTSPMTCPSSGVLVNQQTSTGDLQKIENQSLITTTADTVSTPGVASVGAVIQLTESSSSGSVTDSICTAYEHQQNHGQIIVTTSSSTLSSSAINEEKKSPEKLSKNEPSVLTTMLDGLFQSTNNLMSRSQKSDPLAAEKPCEEFKFSYTDFDNVDHRLKLFFYQNIFEDDNEHFKWLVKGKILNDNHIQMLCDDTKQTNIFDGMFLMSTTKFYILKIVGKERDDITKWIKRQISGTIDRVEIIRVLPWKIGISFTLKNIGQIYLFLQDIPRTDSLLLYFANNPLPDYCTLEYKISERLTQKLLKTTNNIQLIMLAILNSCEIATSLDNNALDKSNQQNYPTLIITETILYLTTNTDHWITDKSSRTIELFGTQFINNLLNVERIDEKIQLKLHFFDENQEKNEWWICTFETNSNAESTLNAISQSWEKLFDVPLGIN